jgi:hypothetical protein
MCEKIILKKYIVNICRSLSEFLHDWKNTNFGMIKSSGMSWQLTKLYNERHELRDVICSPTPNANANAMNNE